jgi:hypothetical protein
VESFGKPRVADPDVQDARSLQVVPVEIILDPELVGSAFLLAPVAPFVDIDDAGS